MGIVGKSIRLHPFTIYRCSPHHVLVEHDDGGYRVLPIEKFEQIVNKFASGGGAC